MDLAGGGEAEEKGGEGGGEHLGNPVEDGVRDGDVATEGHSKRHCRVNVTA